MNTCEKLSESALKQVSGGRQIVAGLDKEELHDVIDKIMQADQTTKKIWSMVDRKPVEKPNAKKQHLGEQTV